MKVAIIAGYAPSILNFRKALILDLVKHAEIAVFAPFEDEATTQSILALGVKYNYISFKPSGLNPYQEFKTIMQLYKKLKTFQADCVLSYTIKPVIWGGLAARRAGVKYIYSMITGLGYTFTDISNVKRKLIHKLVVLLYKKSLEHSNAVFFQNPDDLDLFRQLNIIPKTKKTTILNGSGVDLDYYYPSLPVCEPIRFIMVARLLKDKGIYEYVHAAKIIKASYPNVEFHLVGWIDSNPSAISPFVLQEWLEKKLIIFHGKLADVRKVLAMSSVFVLPSLREGTPRSALEAMSMGKPIITTDVPGCKEVVQAGKNGYLVPVKDSHLLAEAMLKFIANPSLIIQMGLASRALVEEKYDVHKVNREILSVMGFETV